MINNIFINVGRDIGSSLYADDGAIWKRGKNIRHVTNSIQSAILKVERWSYDWGFKMSVAKSCYMFFTRKRRINNVQLKLYGQNMERVKEFKYLGLWFDEKCVWKNHVKQVETKCKKVLNLMRSVSGYQWGADKQSLLDIYRALIRSCIDYGCMIYGAAAKSILGKLDRIQFRALRLCVGAVKTLAYWIKLKGSGEEQPATKVLCDCWEYTNQLKSKGFGWNINAVAEEYGLNSIEYGPTTVWGNVPPWIFPVPNVNLKLLEMKKEWSESKVNNIGYLVQDYVKRNYYNYMLIFTDGSKDPGTEHVGSGVYIPEFDVGICKRINDKLSVYTAEMVWD